MQCVELVPQDTHIASILFDGATERGDHMNSVAVEDDAKLAADTKIKQGQTLK